jgi:6-phosphogluconolactonase/glucosamine-6-phosphate isomerase/deaminase
MSTFKFKPSKWIPYHDWETLEAVRSVKREDMEYKNENGFEVKIVHSPLLVFAADAFHRIYMSDVEDKPLTMICPNQWKEAYQALAEALNRYNVSCRNVHAFAMDEWADEEGNVAPLTYGGGLGYSFRKHFYGQIREDLRPPVENWHVFTNDNVKDYSKILEEVSGGGADICYSATGWPGHTAFIDPDTEEFAADSMEEFLTLGSRLVTQHPLTIAENSLFAPMGSAGDVWSVPPLAVTIGPRDIAMAKDHFEIHSFTFLGGDSWQKMISRLTLYGPITMKCPATIIRLFKGTCYVSEDIAAPFAGWECERPVPGVDE